MTVFENLQFKIKNIDSFVEWLDKYREQSYEPWDCWFDKNHCDKCETIIKENTLGIKYEYSWCELNNNKCRFFQDMNEVPCGKQVIKMWLESEDDDGI